VFIRWLINVLHRWLMIVVIRWLIIIQLHRGFTSSRKQTA